MTHADLVQRACRWLRNTKKCSVVFGEYRGPTIEELPGGPWEAMNANRARVGLPPIDYPPPAPSRTASPDDVDAFMDWFSNDPRNR